MGVATVAKKKRRQTFLMDRAKKRVARFAALHPNVVSSMSDVCSSILHATKDSLWISYDHNLTEALVRNATGAQPELGLGLFIHSVDVNTIPALTSCFRRIAFSTDGGFIAAEELAEVLEADNRADLFIGGSVDKTTQTITFWRGDLKPLKVPLSAFERSGDGTKPNFDKFSVIDCGQTIELGEYEAAVDAILYEYDAQYRRETSKKRMKEDRSFGASLRRLRKQRGYRRQDFEPAISAKTIARIEQGKVSRLHKKTLGVLAKRLLVDPRELGTF